MSNLHKNTKAILDNGQDKQEDITAQDTKITTNRNATKKPPFVGEVRLLTVNEEFSELMPEGLWAHDMTQFEDHKVTATSFAIANNAPLSDEDLTIEEIRTTPVYLMSDYLTGNVDCVETNGTPTFFGPSCKSLGVCPAIEIKLSAAEIQKLTKRTSATGKPEYLIKLGKYLNTNATDEQNAILESMFNKGKLSKNMKSTGRWVTTSGMRPSSGSSIDDKDFLISQNFTPRQVSIFAVKVGSKTEYWGRAIEVPHQSYIYTDKTQSTTGNIRWFKEEPLTFKVTNLQEVIDNTEEKCILRTDQAIIANLPFFPQDDAKDSTKFHNSLIRAWANGIKTNGGDFTHTISKLDNGETMRHGYGSFVEDCFNNQEGFQHFEIPEWQTDIGDFAFQGACHLKSIIIPLSVTSIGKRAFEGTLFSHVSLTSDEKNIVFSQGKSEHIDVIHSQDMSKLIETFVDFDIASALKDESVEELEQIADILYKHKCRLPISYAKELSEQGLLEEFAKSSDPRFFTAEVEQYLTNLGSYSHEEVAAFYKFAKAIGCFSLEKMRDKNGKSTEVLFAQKASTFLAKVLKDGFIPLGDYEKKFSELPANIEPEQDLLKFLSPQGDKDYQNLYMILRLEYNNADVFSKLINNFEKIKSFRLGKDSKSVSWEDAIYKFYSNEKYTNVKKGDEEIAELMAAKGFSESDYARVILLRDRAKATGVPAHILGEKLREETILESIERIKQDTSDCLESSKQLVEKLYSKQFTYEMLDKFDPKNYIIGVFASCCATVVNTQSGGSIATATVEAEDVQNIVVRNYRGDIVAKGSMYINREVGYGVIHSFEIESAYKRREYEKSSGYYRVDGDHKEERDRELIFDAFMRGINNFVNKYDQKNPQKPIKAITVGMGTNRLKRQSERFRKLSQGYSVPVEYGFTDAMIEQRVLYDRASMLREKKRGKEGEGSL